MPRFRRPGSGAPAPKPPRPDRTLELLVVEGVDAGSRFTVDGELVTIGRGAKGSGRTGAICLRDPTVSPRQATLCVADGDVSIEHRQGATNPTLVNGEAVERSAVQVGDRIQMGRTVFEVRSRPGISLSGLMTIPHELLATGEREAPSATTTEIRRVQPPSARITVLRGIRGYEGRVFPLVSLRSRLGRHPSNEVVLPEQGVSRFHAELVWKEESLFLVHKSGTNPTYVDGTAVEGTLRLRGGETVQLADRVALRVDVDDALDATTAGLADDPPEDFEHGGDGRDAAAAARVDSLRERMEEKIRRDQEIEREFGFVGSFLDVDVVDSHGLKVRAGRPEHIIVSFERFRAFAQHVVEEHGGHVLNSNGDELMCFFDEPLQSVRAATAILQRLPEWNASENLLENAFRVRQGIHTGRSLVDRERGVAYSPVLDVAGHLQKLAPENGLLVSAETRAALPDDLPFVDEGELGKGEKVGAWRFAGPEEGDPLGETDSGSRRGDTGPGAGGPSEA